MSIESIKTLLASKNYQSESKFVEYIKQMIESDYKVNVRVIKKSHQTIILKVPNASSASELIYSLNTIKEKILNYCHDNNLDEVNKILIHQ